MGKFHLQPFERFRFRPFLVAADQVPDVLADILIGAVLAHARRHELAELATEADRHGSGFGHGAFLFLGAYSI